MSRTDLNLKKLKAKLLETKEELLSVAETSEEATKPVELDQTTQGRVSRMDALQVQAMAVETDRRRLAEIQRLEAALERIDTEDYGYCVSCDEEIPAKRLEFDPAAAVCIECAN